MLSKEFSIGLFLVLGGSLALYLQQFEWFRNVIFPGYWKAYNTTSWRFQEKVKCAVIIAAGIAMCLGMTPQS